MVLYAVIENNHKEKCKMDKQYYSIYVALIQAIDQSYQEKNIDIAFISESRALLPVLHPDSMGNFEDRMFNMDLVRHYLQTWKKYSASSKYKRVILLIKNLGALVSKDERSNIRYGSIHDQKALDEMNLKVVKEKPNPFVWFFWALFSGSILKLIYSGFF